MSKILIVEDDLDIAEIEQDYLSINDYDTVIISDGNLVMDELAKEKYDLILLDVMLPGKNGFQLLKEIRESYEVPVLMVTAKNETVDKIKGLGFGADDYITKPFDPSELVARVKAHLMRYNRLTGSNTSTTPVTKDVIKVKDLEIHVKAWKVFASGKEIKMANREFELLVFLAENPNIVFSKDSLFDKIWGFDYVGDSATVAVHINRIRDKIEKDPANPEYIETIWGAGYRFNI